VYDVFNVYRHLDVRHRCKLVIVTDYLSDENMLKIAEASTYYVQATRAEGNGLPLMNYLAAGRPGISPRHSAMTDYFDADVGFVVNSHATPTSWPQDNLHRCRASWHQLVWPSLVEQLQQSCDVAANDPDAYRRLAASARSRMRRW